MLRVKFILFLTGLTLATCHRLVHFYRKDYTYFEEYDAYYKLHWDLNGMSWNSAFMACDGEDARLFYPREEGEWNVARKLTAASPMNPNVSDIFVGIHDEFGLGEFITVDGQSTPTPLTSEDPIMPNGQLCVLMDTETGTYKTDSCETDPDTIRPFVCKKVDDKPCPTIDRAYVYKEEAKKCYKVNKRPKAWQDAFHTCFMEGGILAVVENEAESYIVRDMIAPENCYFTGFRRIFSNSILYTVKGQNFEENGFQRWYDKNNEDQEDCGVVYRYSNELYVRTLNCINPLPFVCEMEAKV